MRMGLYVDDQAATIGGGHVLRDDVARWASQTQSRHSIELVGAFPPSAPGPAKPSSRSALHLLRDFARPIPFARRAAQAWRKRQLADEVQKKQIDLLWFNHMAPIDVGRPYIFTVFDVLFRVYPDLPEFAAKGDWKRRDDEVRRAVHGAAFVTVGSEVTRQQVASFYDVSPDKIRVVPMPTPQAALTAAAASAAQADADWQRVREKYRIEGEFIFYPAQFWTHKNHAVLVRALHVLRTRHGLPLVLVLTGSDQGTMDQVRRLVGELGLEQSVHLLGFVPRDDVIALYRAAFALAYVSSFGPENLPPLEAMALGCPVVYSDMPGVRELFGEAPVYVDPLDENAIAAGVARLWKDRDARQQAIETGRVTALANSPDLYFARIFGLLDDVERMLAR